MKIKSIQEEKNISGRRVILRVDLNVPIKDFKVSDDYKILKQIPTIDFLLKRGAKVILLTHLGRPKNGEDNGNLSVKPIYKRLCRLLGKNIKFVPDCVGFEAGTAVSNMKDGDIVMLENIRFEKGEMVNDKILAQKLSKMADLYVNDAFAVSHRSQASVDAIKKYLPSYAGLLLAQEVKHLQKLLDNPQKPLIVVIGGSKIATKINLIKQFDYRAHRILIGGALANNFFAAHGFNVGTSLVDKDSIEFAKTFNSSKVLLPLDVVVNDKIKGEKLSVKRISEVRDEDCIYDIGPETIKFYSGFIKNAKSIIWNGPLGMFEEAAYAFGTLSVARLIASVSKSKAYGVIGGGETVKAAKETKMMDYIDWVSTGGGAMLSFLGREKMPGLKKIIK